MTAARFVAIICGVALLGVVAVVLTVARGARRDRRAEAARAAKEQNGGETFSGGEGHEGR